MRLNLWDNIFGWFGRKLNGATEKRLAEVEKQISNMWINDHRQKILTFARECRNDIPHSSDEWTNALNVAEEYGRYAKEKKITNGIITQNTEYLRSLKNFLWIERCEHMVTDRKTCAGKRRTARRRQRRKTRNM